MCTRVLFPQNNYFPYSPAFSEHDEDEEEDSFSLEEDKKSLQESNSLPSSPESIPEEEPQSKYKMTRPHSRSSRSSNPYVNKKPRFANIYEERLQPLSPCTILSDPSLSPSLPPVGERLSERQTEFLKLIRDSKASPLVQEFLSIHSENISINAFDISSGYTALHSAILSQDSSLVRLLLQYGSNPHIRTRDGLSCVHLAAFGTDPAILNMVLSSSSICNNNDIIHNTTHN
uniref:Notch-regulated ankyrin repeat-containing protein B n=1 Tax=Lepeophtheirus salmonis TaxID=72036 RepID=C1BVR0_LEPSM|nr:Notch-regulated ankyrin repeat-containing protein B [Lepeophtheirus salmonis]